VLIAVLGTSALLIAGYVDLSIGSMVALIGIIVAKVAVATQNPALAAAYRAGARVPARADQRDPGAPAFSISPLIVTLAMLALYGGLAFVVSSTAVYGFPEALLELGRGKLFGVQYTVLIAVAVFIVGAFILTRTVTGLRIYAIGGDPRAAELCGVPVGRTIVGLYAVNGLLIGLVAVLIAGRLGSITPTIGARFELDVLTAAILGGVAFSGGAGRPLGIAIGVATIGILNAGLIFVGLQSWWQSIAVGGMLLLALVADQTATALRHAPRQNRARHPAPGRCPVLRPNRARRRPRRLLRARRNRQSPIFADRRGAKILRRADRARGGDVQRRQGRDRLPARRQRRRQVDFGEDHFGRAAAGCRRDAPRGPAGAVQKPAGCAPGRARDRLPGPGALPEPLSVSHNMMLGREQTRRWLGFMPVRDDRQAAEQCRAARGARRDAARRKRAGAGAVGRAAPVDRHRSRPRPAREADLPGRADGGARRQADGAGGRPRPLDRGAGTGVILVTHDLATVRALADRIVVLSLGRVVYDGPSRTSVPTSCGA
jgi:ribose/xylose/arabinose/galactoside ABC-type transport system permease subunit